MESGLNRHEPLYLKHRPKALDKLVGQAAVYTTLKNAIEHSRLSHAYLFTGPRGTGKTSTARILAKSLNCESGPTAVPCQTCTTCTEITQGTSPAVFEIDAASNNSVDDARVLIERAPLVAVGGRFKLYIIDECHMLTKEAFNALLKTIEEPPPGVVFILATTEEHKVPPTIISRCQRLMFRLVSQSDLAPYLRHIADIENIHIEDQAINLIARRSGGGLRDALGLLDQASLLSAPGQPVTVHDLLTLLGSVHEDILLDISAAVQCRDGQGALSLVGNMLIEGREPAVLALELARHFLNLTKASYLAEDKNSSPDVVQGLIVGSPDYIEGLLRQAPLFERSELTQIVEHLDRLEQVCRRTTQPAMNLEMGLLSICHRHDMVLVQELTQRVARLEQALSDGAPPTVAHLKSPARTPATTKVSRQDAVAVMPTLVGEEATLAGSPPPAPHTSYDAGSSTDVDAPPPQPLAVKQPEKEAVKIENPAFISAEPVKVSIADIEEPGAPDIADLSALTISTGLEKKTPEPTESVVPFEELNALWERLLDDLKHIPTRSILSTQAFLVAVSARKMVIGVQTEALRKMVENKLQHVKPVAQDICGHDIYVKVKVVSDPQADIAQSKAPTGSAVSAASPSRREPDEQPKSDGVAADVTRVSAYRASEISAKPSDAQQPAEKTTSLSEPNADLFNNAVPDADSASVLKEAYRLFEGPGSRRIMPT